MRIKRTILIILLVLTAATFAVAPAVFADDNTVTCGTC
jgi:hypothetical protein